MVETYQQIFDQRAGWYHEAMGLCPKARANEFAAALELAELTDGMKIADMPSGGGYLLDFLPSDLEFDLISIDSSSGFSRLWDGDARIRRHHSPLASTPLSDNEVDLVVSVAGLHHEEDRVAIFREMRRILKPDGRLCIVEVPVGAITDGFLNGFVNDHNSMGHEGRFLDAGFRADLESGGFKIQTDELRRYTWDFVSEDEMAGYFKLLFGIDQATDRDILAGISQHLGYIRTESDCRVNWELQLVRCQ